jgi:hypothetical protein
LPAKIKGDYYMATFDKDVLLELVKKAGSWESFARADGCFRIYESDSNYHVCRQQSDVESILSSPYVKNPREVWPKQGAVTRTPVQATEEPVRASERPAEKKSNCFIATAAYGSPYAHEVVYLRHFRDTVLLSYRYGRSFVSIYELLSPRLAAYISVRPWLRFIVRHTIVEPILLIIRMFKGRPLA